MKMCKIASQSDCPEKICCFDCKCKDYCLVVCNKSTFEECGELFEESTALQEFSSEAMILMKNIAELDKQKKLLEDKEVREELKKAMDKFGIKSFDNEFLKVVYVPKTTRTSIDSAKLKREYPHVAEECSKTSKVSASVRITVK